MILNEDEIDEARAILVERHPLYFSNIPITQIFPFLKGFSRSKDQEPENIKIQEQNDSFIDTDEERSDGFKQGKKEHERRKRVQMQQWKSKKGFLTLGYGFVAYFNLLEFMILLFAVLTLLSLPSLYFYATYRYVEDETVSSFSKLHMANLGYSSTLCRDVHLAVGKLSLSGETGVIKEVVSFGIIPDDAKILDACLPNEETESCEDVTYEPDVIKSINDEGLDKDIGTFDVLSFIDKTKTNNTHGISDYARFYTQVYGKIESEEEFQSRKSIQLLLVWTTIITAFVYTVSIEVYAKIAEEKLEEYDQETTTCSDFTAIYSIPPDLYEKFQNEIFPSYKDHLFAVHNKIFSKIQAFKYYLIDGIEKALKEAFPSDNDDKNDTERKDRAESELIKMKYATNDKEETKLDRNMSSDNKNEQK